MDASRDEQRRAFEARLSSYTGSLTPQCAYCRRATRAMTCPAFPEWVPDAIALNHVPHDRPYPGDGGILFEPASGEAARAFRALFA